MMIDVELTNASKIDDENISIMYSMLGSLLNNYANNAGTTSLPFWMDKYSDHKQANTVIKDLAEQGVIHTTVKHNFATLEISEEYLLNEYTQDELNKLITATKMNKYQPLIDSNETPELPVNTKLKSGIKESGLVRFGFAEAGMTHQFKYDTVMMTKYRPEIVKYSVKAMLKMEAKLQKSLRMPEKFDYQSIIEQVIDLIIASPNEEYILGTLTNDSRGRAIYQCLRTIFNPLANKMARALIVAKPETVTPDSLDNAYLFIAEMYSGFNGDIPAKIRQGKSAYKFKRYHKLDTNTDQGIDDLFENIWLERLYLDLSKYYADKSHKVTTSLEIDFSALNLGALKTH